MSLFNKMEALLSIIIPVYNEGKNIKRTIAEINNKVNAPSIIYIIYDDENDDTIPAVKEVIHKASNILLLKNEYGKGFVNAIRTGINKAEGSVILIIMGDASDDLSNVDQMLRSINDGSDIVCGSRYMKGGKQIGGPWLKKLLSKAAGISLHYLTGIPTHDATNSFKMYKKQYFNEINIESKGGFEFGIEMVVKAFKKKHKIAEVPCTWRDSQEKESRFRLWQWLPKYLHWYWYAIKNRW